MFYNVSHCFDVLLLDAAIELFHEISFTVLVAEVIQIGDVFGIRHFDFVDYCAQDEPALAELRQLALEGIPTEKLLGIAAKLLNCRRQGRVVELQQVIVMLVTKDFVG